MRDHRKTLTFPEDPATDLLTAEAFSAFVAALSQAPAGADHPATPLVYLDTLGTTGRTPAWFSLDAERRRHKVASTIHVAARDTLAQLKPHESNLPLRQTVAAAARLGNRIAFCSEKLAALQNDLTNAIIPLAMRCSSRWCPPCAISRSYSRAFQILAALAPLAQTRRLTHAVFTCPNVPLESLRAACRGLSGSLRALLRPDRNKHRAYPSVRGIRGTLHNLEVTYSPTRDDYHPHRHAILDTDFLDQDALSWDWSLCLTQAGFPAVQSLVYLARIKPNDKHGKPDDDTRPSTALADAVFEVAKYIAKPADAYDGDGYPTRDLPQLIAEMKGLRSSDATGTIKALLKKEPKPEDAPTFAWLGTLTQLLHQNERKNLDDVLQATAKDRIARTILARHYPDLLKQPTRRHAAESEAPNEDPDPRERDWQGDQADLLD